jgi:hypothetical protein
LDYTKWRQNLSSVNVKELIIIGVYNMVIYIPDSIEKCRTESNNNFHFENILESRLQVLHVGVFYPSKLLPQSLTRLVIDSITTDVIVKDPMEKDISLPNLKYLVIKSCYHNELKHIQLPDYMIALDVHLNGSYFKMPRIVENLRLLPPCPSWLCDHINPGAFGWPEVVYNLDASRVVLFKDSHLFMCWNFIKVLKCKHMCGLVYPNSLRELTIDKLCDKDIFPESLERLTLPIEYCQRYFRDVLFYKYNNVTKNGDYYTIISSKLSQLVTKHVC